ncbi:Protein kinase-like domain [Pseudocohnilembus persalinus]|uniref:Protein kinase-like domain n=1 Tax=Pseudocohnilembus persalinus TaxID=266149 RepID=A0A0V0R9N3_PSEPJ|nr:Protein kinase-like domain [Pseudocohnilembus persalinus]|eukprot:KRX11179.1 Protein kinase-like domain [Pseudocohnilembus persalinus]
MGLCQSKEETLNEKKETQCTIQSYENNIKKSFQIMPEREFESQVMPKESLENIKDSRFCSLIDPEQNDNTRVKICIDDFEILKNLGKGSFGKVLLVRYKENQQFYAMKIILKEKITNQKQKTHAITERYILEKIDFPFIVQLHYSFQNKTKLYLAVDYMSGGELFFHLKKNKGMKFSETQTRFYAAEILLALEHLHKNNIIYRDLKPENILLDEKGHIKVTDFGLSKQILNFKQHAHSMCGTPEYLAPEILLSGPQGHDKTCDWWSFGSVIYEMLCGAPPHYCEDKKLMFKRNCQVPIPYPRQYFSDKAISLLSQLLVVNPKKRLGYGEQDAKSIKEHEFFNGIDFDKLLKKEITPPIDITKMNSFQFFDQNFVKQQPKDTPVDSSKYNFPKSIEQFPDFTYCREVLNNKDNSMAKKSSDNSYDKLKTNEKQQSSIQNQINSIKIQLNFQNTDKDSLNNNRHSNNVNNNQQHDEIQEEDEEQNFSTKKNTRDLQSPLKLASVLKNQSNLMKPQILVHSQTLNLQKDKENENKQENPLIKLEKNNSNLFHNSLQNDFNMKEQLAQKEQIEQENLYIGQEFHKLNIQNSEQNYNLMKSQDDSIMNSVENSKLTPLNSNKSLSYVNSYKKKNNNQNKNKNQYNINSEQKQQNSLNKNQNMQNNVQKNEFVLDTDFDDLSPNNIYNSESENGNVLNECKQSNINKKKQQNQIQQDQYLQQNINNTKKNVILQNDENKDNSNNNDTGSNQQENTNYAYKSSKEKSESQQTLSLDYSKRKFQKVKLSKKETDYTQDEKKTQTPVLENFNQFFAENKLIPNGKKSEIISEKEKWEYEQYFQNKKNNMDKIKYLKNKTNSKSLSPMQTNKQDNLPWVEKYRPSKLEDLIAHESIVQTIEKFVDENRLPNLLFYGPPGTGKTSTIIALAKQIYGDAYKSNVLEMNASDERGINSVREVIKDFVSTSQISFKKVVGPRRPKLVILDEADNMTNAAQFALRRLIEKFSNNARFCLICNYVSKIIPALQSRCTRFKFRHLDLQQAKPRIQEICENEGINCTEKGVIAAFALCEGDMRRVVNMLQSLSLSQSKSKANVVIDDQYVYNYTGNITPQDIEQINNILMTENIQNAYKLIKEMQIVKGISLQVIIKDLNLFLIEVDMDTRMKEFIIQRLADIEYRMSINGDEKVQLLSLIGAYVETRQTVDYNRQKN